MSAGWQPIETAPRDGTVIILFNEDEQAVDAGYWHPDFYAFEVTLGDHWYPSDCKYWMRLPAPPVSA